MRTQKRSNEEPIYVALGALVGAAVAGTIGALFGSAIGYFIGKIEE